MISVLILTLNEERNLPGCLDSIAGCDDIVVLDSGSTDRTTAVARERGARVLEHAFTDFALQRNHAHAAATFRHEWVLHLDADERCTPALWSECKKIAAAGLSECDGYYIAPRLIFMGRWIPHCTDYPAWQARFAQRDRFRFVQVGHGQREAPEMRMGRMQSGYDHVLGADSAAAWLAKHERYARDEARALGGQTLQFGAEWRRITQGPALERRRALKRLWLRLPARPVLRFLYQYGWRRGFLDGRAGFCYCRWLSRYEALITRELRRASTAP